MSPAEGGPTIHGSAVLLGSRAILIRGPAGSGKSRLALNLIRTAIHGPPMLALLVADDRIHVRAANARLLAWPPAALAGLIEVRGVGIRRVPHEPIAVVSLVVDLGADSAQRLPEAGATQTVVAGVPLARLAVAPGDDPLPMIFAVLTLPPFAAAPWQHAGGLATAG